MSDKIYKLLVVDIDGTIMNSKGTISTEDTAALTKASKLGVSVAISTGRAVLSSIKVLEQLSLDGYHIFFDGALVYNPETKEELFTSPIENELLEQLTDYSNSLGLDTDFYSVTKYFVARETWITDIRRDFYGLNPIVTNLKETMLREKIIKGAIVVASSEERTKAEEIGNHFADRLEFSWTTTPAYPEIVFINVIAPDVSKGKALEALASHLRINLAEVMAIGDGANDISLLSTAGLGIAVENASDELKAVADYITLDVEHSGVAAAVNKFLL